MDDYYSSSRIGSENESETDTASESSSSSGDVVVVEDAPAPRSAVLAQTKLPFKANALSLLMQAAAKRPRAEAGIASSQPQRHVAQRRKKGGGSSNFTPRTTPCPFSKKVPGTPIVVDAFQWASPALTSHYVLTHFHSDHYGGLGKKFSAGTIYCTEVTANLVKTKLGVDASRLCAIRFHTPTPIYANGSGASTASGGGAGTSSSSSSSPRGLLATLTFLPANHCPGSAMVLFEVPGPHGSVSSVLHTGDVRWSPPMRFFPALAPFTASARRRLDFLFLDTTYADKRYTFPRQEAVIAAAIALARPFAERPDTQLLFGSYTIGKERLFLSVARALGERVCVSPAHLRILLQCKMRPSDAALLTTDPTLSRIHVVPMRCLTLGRLEKQWRDMRGRGGGGGAGAGAEAGGGRGG